ncbi:hypothetical protein N657DRAFT_651163 [Parathielavia appendiculata]|uniref:Uncharacterized protein n=1 Tax=Parathielavia appendiculata TaxID=2587402 RepID=A0AAN6TQP4_9PEZI|nr:hypothetical protein N657DRAFT_651160 [Parathielavia appendiculata]KAK4118528.1 hypothetical protein N657DRAFT_651163 [Parathielavia appendiculata]
MGTYEPLEVSNKRHADLTVCAPGTGYFQSCSNGFRGCCKADACSGSGQCADSTRTGTSKSTSTRLSGPD